MVINMLENKLKAIKEKLKCGKIKIMILGLGSVGNYLLDYLLSVGDERIEITVAGRNTEKMQQDVNIATVAATIRGICRSRVIVEGNTDLESVESISDLLERCSPDIIVNTSRVYAGLKYGSISWKNLRAYGIWTPLSVRYIRNIMLAYEKSGCNAIVINTSYSDATLPWLKSAGLTCPDFGSGNLNHLIPRIKMAVAKEIGISDYWNVSVSLASSHFHDVVISKEGHTEGVSQLLYLSYSGKTLQIDQERIFSLCSIAMPSDQKRNMMNASSNFNIIMSILSALDNESRELIHSPGVFGNIGGYPVIIDGEKMSAYIDESHFTLEQMSAKNRESIALDGIEDIRDGCIVYTDKLIEKTKSAFFVTLPKTVAFNEIDSTAEFIIDNIIKPSLGE